MIESVSVMLMHVIREITVSRADPRNLYWRGPNRCPPRENVLQLIASHFHPFCLSGRHRLSVFSILMYSVIALYYHFWSDGCCQGSRAPSESVTGLRVLTMVMVVVVW